jgi:polysaccharide biosynthesis/export protein
MKPTVIACCLIAAGLAGCSGVPTAGPTTSQVMKQVARDKRQFDMVEIDGQVVSALAAQPEISPLDQFRRNGKPPSPTIGVGDTISVSIWQANNGQMLSPLDQTGGAGGTLAGGQAGGSVVIPDQTVGADGGVSVPYAGRVPAAGRTPLEVQQVIQQRLADQLVQPQVIVTVTKAVSDSVTVSGEDVTGARIHLSVGGDRLMDVIAAAGGSKSPVYATSVRLSRDGQTATIPMTTLISNPRDNIYAWPGDVITLLQTPETFSVFGATLNNTQVPFGAEHLDLAQAIAKSGGLIDQRADPEGVFLLRFEPRAVVNALGVPDLANGSRRSTPVLYHLNLRQVDGYFLAERIAVQDNDLIYVANAQMSEVQKFFTLIGTITGPVIGGAVLTNSIH